MCLHTIITIDRLYISISNVCDRFAFDILGTLLWKTRFEIKPHLCQSFFFYLAVSYLISSRTKHWHVTSNHFKSTIDHTRLCVANNCEYKSEYTSHNITNNVIINTHNRNNTRRVLIKMVIGPRDREK